MFLQTPSLYTLHQKRWDTFTFIWFYRLIFFKIVLSSSLFPSNQYCFSPQRYFAAKQHCFEGSGECSTLYEDKTLVYMYVSKERDKVICGKVSQGLLTEIVA